MCTCVRIHDVCMESRATCCGVYREVSPVAFLSFPVFMWVPRIKFGTQMVRLAK